MKICVVGTGYVGLVTGTGFAEIGNHVVCVDTDADKVERLQRGELPIFEPGLEEMVSRNVRDGRLSFSSDPASAIAASRVVFVAVGTPSRRDGGAHLGSVDAVAETVREHAAQETVLILKSTVPVGTNARIRRIVRDARRPVHVVSNPEFLKEGEAIGDFLRPDRIVIGLTDNDEHARGVMARLYHPVCLNRDHIVWMNPESAELTKYVANTMLAMRISFMNEVAGLCEKVGADIHSVRHGISNDPRIGGKFLYAGPGYGGSCFPKDVAALVHTAREHDIELELAGATDRVNQRQKGVLIRKLRKRKFGPNLIVTQPNF
jgi:UDPglucose 6-dehydrogenase